MIFSTVVKLARYRTTKEKVRRSNPTFEHFWQFYILKAACLRYTFCSFQSISLLFQIITTSIESLLKLWKLNAAAICLAGCILTEFSYLLSHNIGV
jgi:hypothetical protein